MQKKTKDQLKVLKEMGVHLYLEGRPATYSQIKKAKKAVRDDKEGCYMPDIFWSENGCEIADYRLIRNRKETGKKEN